MADHHFQCHKCKEWKANYNYPEKAFICEDCGHKEFMKARKSRCFSCGRPYTEYTWFDPSGCPNCNRSFVD